MCVHVCVHMSVPTYPQLGLHMKHFVHQTSFGRTLLFSNDDALFKQEHSSLWFLQHSLNGEQVALTTDLTQLGGSPLDGGDDGRWEGEVGRERVEGGGWEGESGGWMAWY